MKNTINTGDGLQSPLLESATAVGQERTLPKMKRYSFLHAFFMSFFSKSLYQDIGRHWRGTGLLYLFILLVIVWVPTMIRMQIGMSRFVAQEAPQFTNQIPRITITNGVVSTDVPTPYSIKDAQGNPMMIIDTTGAQRELEDDSTAALLLTRDKVIFRNQARGETRTYDLSGVQSFELDRARVEDWLQTAKLWLVPVLFPILLIFSFAARIIQVLIYAAIGLLFARMMNTNLEYKTSMRLAAVALTPVLLLNLALEFLPFNIPLWWLLGTLIGLGYLFFAVKSNSEPAPAPDQSFTPPPAVVP